MQISSRAPSYSELHIESETQLGVIENTNCSTISIPTNTRTKQRYPNYYEDNLRPDWNFHITKHFNDSLLYSWSEPNQIDKSAHLGRGENGTSFHRTHEEKKLLEKLQKEHNYNYLATENMSLRRTLPDYRFPECRDLVYPEKLPKASVIIIFHDEAWSLLLRTVWSIIDRSAEELLQEIILVDDVSTWPQLKRPLDDYVLQLPVSVTILRTEKREGLIRARLIGAKHAKVNFIIFRSQVFFQDISFISRGAS